MVFISSKDRVFGILYRRENTVFFFLLNAEYS